VTTLIVVVASIAVGTVSTIATRMHRQRQISLDLPVSGWVITAIFVSASIAAAVLVITR